VESNRSHFLKFLAKKNSESKEPNTPVLEREREMSDFTPILEESEDTQPLDEVLPCIEHETTPTIEIATEHVIEPQTVIIDGDLDQKEEPERRQIVWEISLDKVKEQMKIREDLIQQDREKNILPNGNFVHNLEVSDKIAQVELQRNFKKEHFKDMEIIGQFNKGFILVKLQNDLFIVDQHASDEKYNFEQLRATTIINSQKLLW
jgi:DNA mismatch repair protein PMS2